MISFELLFSGWLDLTSYYATAYKTGSFPMITKDKLVIWARTHPGKAKAPDPVGPPANFQLVSVIFVTFIPEETLSCSHSVFR